MMGVVTLFELFRVLYRIVCGLLGILDLHATAQQPVG
jgi:hypothetical protein